MGSDQPNSPQRVVILGGGPAGVAAAYWLSRPEQQGRYSVSLYSQGWRLGGKCASGRNAAHGNRIEEHGLHLLMGCYWNGFTTLRECYADWRALKQDPKNPLQRWTDAFLPQRLVSMMAQDGPGSPPTWSPWNFHFLDIPGSPGDPDPPSDEQLILRMADWMQNTIPADAVFGATLRAALDKLRGAIRDPVDSIPGAQAALQEAGASIQASLRDLHGYTDTPDSQSSHRSALLLDLGVAIGFGYLRDLFGKGVGAYDALDVLDFKAWLLSCHASPEAVDAAPVRGFYDLAFATVGEASNRAAGTMAAGASLRAQMEMALGYRGAPLWKMAAGMGDTVFTPFYDVLTARGVEIHFFSRVAALHPSADGDALGDIEIVVQATTVDGSPYRPLVRVNELDCWPDRPDWRQLTDGAALEAAGVDFESSFCTVSSGPPLSPKILRAGADFDVAIVAMPPDSLRVPAADLILADAGWKNAMQGSASVATQSLQLWMKPTLQKLGWSYGTTVLTAFTEPYDSWGDMSQVLDRESWSEGSAPGSIGYFCGAMPYLMGPVTPPEMKAAAAQAADEWTAGNLRTLWPEVSSLWPANPDVLERYVVANFDGSDRYVLTPAGANVASRLSPAQPAGFANLYVVGDWTKTRFSGGCFESAIESAMLASCGISGFPTSIKTA